MGTGGEGGRWVTQQQLGVNKGGVQGCTDHGVGHLQHLFKQRVFLFVASAGVHDDDLKVLAFELVHALGGDDHRIHLCVAGHSRGVRGVRGSRAQRRSSSPAVERDPGFGGVLFQLVERA